MLTTIECAGHPRDMGLAQGAASRGAIRAEVERLGLPTRRSRLPTLRPLVAGVHRGEGAGREFFRHFAHQAERLEGLARSAGVPMDSVLDLHLRLRAGGAAGGLLSRRATVRARAAAMPGQSPAGAAGIATAASGSATAATGDATASAGNKGVVLERTLPGALEGEAGWILRESRPEVGFRSVEITLPWLVSALAGVNEGGLAVVAGPLLWGAPGRAGSPTSLLLVQECLQRFSDLDGAIGWCLKRPVEGEQSIVLADASGAVATVVSTGRERRVQRGEGELHLEGGEPAASEIEGRDSDRGASVGGLRIDPAARRILAEVAGSTVDVSIEAPTVSELSEASEASNASESSGESG